MNKKLFANSKTPFILIQFRLDQFSIPITFQEHFNGKRLLDYLIKGK